MDEHLKPPFAKPPCKLFRSSKLSHWALYASKREFRKGAGRGAGASAGKNRVLAGVLAQVLLLVNTDTTRVHA